MPDAYGKIARWYDHIFEPLNSGLRGIGLKMYPPEPEMHVLDIGCGTGAHLKLYEQKKCFVYGIDMSPAMLNMARKKLGSYANLHLGDAREMPYPDSTFDLILSSTVLHELTRDVQSGIIENAKRVLKQDGGLLLIDFHPGPLKFIKGWISKIIITIAELSAGREHYKNYRIFIKSKGLDPLIKAHNLKIEKEKIVSGGNIVVYLLKK